MNSVKDISHERIIDFLKKSYDCKEIQTLIEVHATNAAWIVESENIQFVLKIFNCDSDYTDRIAEEATLFDFLNKHHLNVPRIVKNSDGHSVSVFDDGQDMHSALFMHYEDAAVFLPSKISPENIRTIGQATAQLHMALATYPVNLSLYEKWHWEEQKSTFSLLLTSKNKDIFTSEELKKIESVDQNACEFLHSLSKNIFEPLQQSILHGDINLGHARFLPNGEVFFLDFGDRIHGPIAYELATLRVGLFRKEDISFEKLDELYQSFLDGYMRYNPLSPTDIQSVSFLSIKRALDEIHVVNTLSLTLEEPIDDERNKRRYRLIEHDVLESLHS